MQFTVLTVFCLSLIVSSSWSQSTQMQASGGLQGGQSGGQGSMSGSMSISGSSGRMVDLFLHPLRPFLGEAGHKALHNAIEVIPMSVLNQVSNLGQLFGALVTFNPTAIPTLMNQFFPGASSMFASLLPTLLPSLLPSLGSAGLSALGSMATSGLGSPNSNNRLGSGPLSSMFRQNFPASQRENMGASGLPSNQGLNAFNPANIASDLVGQGMSNLAGVSSSLANGQPLSTLLTMAGGAADTVGRFGNLASNGLNMASQAAQTATGLASQLPGPIGQMSNTFASMIPGASSFNPARGNGASGYFDGSASLNGGDRNGAGSGSFGASASTGSGRGQGRGSMFSSPLTNLLSNNPFTSFLSG